MVRTHSTAATRPPSPCDRKPTPDMGRPRGSPTMQERNRRASMATSSTKEDALRFGEVDTNGDQALDLYERDQCSLKTCASSQSQFCHLS